MMEFLIQNHTDRYKIGLNRKYRFTFDIDTMNDPAFSYANKGFGAKFLNSID